MIAMADWQRNKFVLVHCKVRNLYIKRQQYYKIESVTLMPWYGRLFFSNCFLVNLSMTM